MHAVQYWFMAGLLYNRRTTMLEVAREMEKRGFPGYKSEPGKKSIVALVEEQDHFGGKRFSAQAYPILHTNIENIRNVLKDDSTENNRASLLAAAAHHVCLVIARASSLEEGLSRL